VAINTEFNPNPSTGAPSGRVVEHATRIAEEARALSGAISSGASRINESVDLAGRVQRNPLLMVAAAAGIGYVLGGGLFSPFTGRLFKIGVRAALIPFVKGQLAAIAAAAPSNSGNGTPGF
jgi:hypothetical protein